MVSPGLTLALRTFPQPSTPGLGSTWADITSRSSGGWGILCCVLQKQAEAVLQAASLAPRRHVARWGEALTHGPRGPTQVTETPATGSARGAARGARRHPACPGHGGEWRVGGTGGKSPRNFPGLEKLSLDSVQLPQLPPVGSPRSVISLGEHAPYLKAKLKPLPIMMASI